VFSLDGLGKILVKNRNFLLGLTIRDFAMLTEKGLMGDCLRW